MSQASQTRTQTRGRGRGRGGRGRARKVIVNTETDITQKNNQPLNKEDDEPVANEPLNKENGGKRKRSKPVELTLEQQEDVAEWYRENELLYNKGTFVGYFDFVNRNLW